MVLRPLLPARLDSSPGGASMKSIMTVRAVLATAMSRPYSTANEQENRLPSPSQGRPESVCLQLCTRNSEPIVAIVELAYLDGQHSTPPTECSRACKFCQFPRSHQECDC